MVDSNPRCAGQFVAASTIVGMSAVRVTIEVKKEDIGRNTVSEMPIVLRKSPRVTRYWMGVARPTLSKVVQQKTTGNERLAKKRQYTKDPIKPPKRAK